MLDIKEVQFITQGVVRRIEAHPSLRHQVHPTHLHRVRDDLGVTNRATVHYHPFGATIELRLTLDEASGKLRCEVNWAGLGDVAPERANAVLRAFVSVSELALELIVEFGS